MAGAGFWDNPESAQSTVAKLKSINAIVKPLAELLTAGEDLAALVEMTQEDASLGDELLQELSSMEYGLEHLELKSLLDGPHDLVRRSQRRRRSSSRRRRR